MISSNKKQEIFRLNLLGVLIYAIVLGFFNDYTAILNTSSYSTTFAVALVMQILTFFTFMAKDYVVRPFKGKDSPKMKILLGISVWFVMFVSKFVFLGAIGLIFRDDVEISGFIGLIAIIAVMTLLQQAILIIDKKLGN